MGSVSWLRQDVYLYASKVTDRFGNWVQYSFDPVSSFQVNGSRHRLYGLTF